MLREVNNFILMRDKLCLLCLGIINIVITIAYSIEFLMSDKHVGYLIFIFCLLWICYAIGVVLHVKIKYRMFAIYPLLIGLNSFYAFTTFTGESELTWLYIFPFLTVLPLYYTRLDIVYTGTIGFSLVNLIDIVCNFGNYTNMLDLELRIFCMSLSILFTIISCTVMNKYSEIMNWFYKESAIDALTGIHGSAYLNSFVAPLIQKNKNFPYTMVFLDLDTFGEINTTYGTDLGDKILVAVTDVCKNNIEDLSTNTILCRYEDDKFVLLFQNRDMQDVKEYYTNIKRCINSTILKYKQNEIFISVTVTVTDTRFCKHDLNVMLNRCLELKSEARKTAVNQLLEDYILGGSDDDTSS